MIQPSGHKIILMELPLVSKALHILRVNKPGHNINGNGRHYLVNSRKNNDWCIYLSLNI